MNRTEKRAATMVLAGLLLALPGLVAGCGRYAPPIRPEPEVQPAVTPATEVDPGEPAPEGWEFDEETGELEDDAGSDEP